MLLHRMDANRCSSGIYRQAEHLSPVLQREPHNSTRLNGRREGLSVEFNSRLAIQQSVEVDNDAREGNDGDRDRPGRVLPRSPPPGCRRQAVNVRS